MRRYSASPDGLGRRVAPPQVRSEQISGLPDYAFDSRWQWAALLLLGLTAIARLASLRSVAIAPEAVTLLGWPGRLAFANSVEGPLAGFILRVGGLFAGSGYLALNSVELAASLCTLQCGYVLARRLFSPLTGVLVVALIALSPLVELGSKIAACDPLLLLFWSLAVVWLERALFAERRAEQNRAWTIAGLVTGLGGLASHGMLLLPLCYFLFLLVSPTHRIWLRRSQTYLAFLFVPLIVSGIHWRFDPKGWIFVQSLNVGWRATDAPLHRLGEMGGAQALIVGPVQFFGALITALKSLFLNDRAAGAQRCRFLACAGLPVIALIYLVGLMWIPPSNWTTCATLPLTVLWAGWLTTWAGRSRRDAVLAFSLAVVACAVSLFLTFVALR